MTTPAETVRMAALTEERPEEFLTLAVPTHGRRNVRLDHDPDAAPLLGPV